MCSFKLLKSPACGHVWGEIVTPCGDEMGFNSCPSLKDRRLRGDFKNVQKTMAPADSCPKCKKNGDYDGKKIRMVKNIKEGCRVGLGPATTSLGYDFVVADTQGVGNMKPITVMLRSHVN